MRELEEAQGFWAMFGPTTLFAMVFCTACECSIVMFCFRRFYRGMMKYEESPQNPGQYSS